MDNLKPCPFCGGEARTMEQHRWWVACQECMCDLGFEGMDEKGCYGHYDTEAEAIEAWNTRANDTLAAENDITANVDGVATRTCHQERTCKHYEIDGLDVVFTPWHSEYMDEDFVAVAIFRDGQEVYHAGMTHVEPSEETARETAEFHRRWCEEHGGQ